MKKKFAFYILFAFLVIGTAFYFYGYQNSYLSNIIQNYNDRITKQDNKELDDSSLKNITQNTKIKQVAEKDIKYVCGDNIQNSGVYIQEFLIPFPCSQPVGLTMDKNNNLWIAADWAGYFFVFNPQSETFIKHISLPNWPSGGTFGSMIWDMKFDKNGDLWFTDEQSNSVWKYFTKENKFERYKSPTKNSYPSSLAFDSKNRVWFTEIFGKKLGIINPLEAKNNTSVGIKEIDLGKKVKFETTGPLSAGFKNTSYSNNNDKANDILWLSTVDFPYGGQIIKVDTTKENFTVYEVNKTKSVPISIAEDDKGQVWANDHASSLFLLLDTKTGNVKQFATSPATTRITPTLPYYNAYRDGKIWFNEHEGNTIAYYQPENNTLIEYHIPTRNFNWGNTSNPLQFTIDNNGSIWFTEWTENKLGFIQKEKINQYPISMTLSKDKLILDSKSGKGDNVDVFVYRNNKSIINDNSQVSNEISNGPINMTATSSISKIGVLWNITGKFNNNLFFLSNISDKDPYKVNFEVNPLHNVVPGNYTLTISARYDNIITYSKIIDLIVI
jgi:virginiamycin B lyase